MVTIDTESARLLAAASEPLLEEGPPFLLLSDGISGYNHISLILKRVQDCRDARCVLSPDFGSNRNHRILRSLRCPARFFKPTASAAESRWIAEDDGRFRSPNSSSDTKRFTRALRDVESKDFTSGAQKTRQREDRTKIRHRLARAAPGTKNLIGCMQPVNQGITSSFVNFRKDRQLKRNFGGGHKPPASHRPVRLPD
jgi:hypothetical protein